MRHGESSVLQYLLILRKGVKRVKTKEVREFCKSMGWWNGKHGLQDFFNPKLEPMPSTDFLRMAKRKKWLSKILDRAEEKGGVITEPDFYEFAPPAILRNNHEHPEYAVYSAFELFLWFWTAEIRSNFLVAFDSDTYFPANADHYLPPEKGWIYFKRCTDPDLQKAVRKRFLSHYIKLVRKVAAHMAMNYPKSVELSDLISTGTIGLIEAFEHYDPSRGFKFETYAVPRIRGSILDELRKLDWVPRSVRKTNRDIDEAMLKMVLEMTDQFTPGLREVAEKLNISQRELSHHLFEKDRGTMISLHEFWYPNDEDTLERISVVADKTSVLPTEWVSQRELFEATERFLIRLTAQESMVIRLYYWWELRLHQIGKIMGISETRVSQVHTKGLDKLRSMYCREFGISYVVQSNGSVKYFDVPASGDTDATL